MPIVNWFAKPRWKHKDVTTRAAAVGRESDPQLLASLPDIARHDSAHKVRAAAVRRLQDIPLLLRIAREDNNTSVQKSAWQTLERQLIEIRQEDFSRLTEQLQTIDNPDLIKNLARQATDPAIRGFFQQKITAQGLIGELLLTETDTNLQQALARQLEKPATLQRVIKKLGKRSPALRQLLQEQLEKHDPAIRKRHLHEQASALCEQLENLIHGQKQQQGNQPGNNKQTLQNLEKQWQELLAKTSQQPELNLSESIQNRFQGALNTARIMLDPARREEFLGRQREERLKQAIGHAQQLIESLKKDPASVSGENWNKARYTLEKQLAQINDSPQQATAQALLQQMQAIESNQLQSQKSAIDPDIAHAQKILAQLEKTRKKSQLHSRDLTRLRQQWDEWAKNHRQHPEFNDLNRQFNRGMEQLAEALTRQIQQRDQAAQTAIDLLGKIDTAIKDGHLAEAKQLFNQHLEKKKLAGPKHPLIRQNKHRIDRTWNALKELRQWQRWSNDKVRQRLIDELKAIPATGWHPDAILAKLKESSAQWKALEEQEKLEGDRYPVRNATMWKEFRALQDALFELAQPYFAERSQHWNENLQQVEDLIETLSGIDPQELDTRQLSRHVRNAVSWLKKLEALPPAERGRIAKNLRQHIDRMDAPLKTHYAEARANKQALIKKSQSLLALEDLPAAIAEAKVLQKQWKTAGFVPPPQERNLWKKFRRAQDAVFARLDAEKQRAQAEKEAARTAASSFLNDIRQRATGADTPEAINALLGELESGWHVHRDSGQTRHRAELEQDLRQRLRDIRQNQHIQTLKLLQQANELCCRLENAEINQEDANQQWQESIEPKLASLGKAATQPVWQKQQARFALALKNTGAGPQASNKNATDNYLATLIAAEFLTGLATPADFSEQRQAYQVERLARRMSGESLPDSTTEARELLEKLFTLAVVDSSIRRQQAARQQAVEKALFDLLHSSH